MNKRDFYELSYQEIFESYLAEFDEDGALVTLRQRLGRLFAGEKSGDIARAAQELPSVEELQIPQDVLLCGVPLDYCLMWWGIWRKRGLFDTEALRRKWYEERRAQPPRGWRDLERN